MDEWEMNNIKAFTNKVIEHLMNGDNMERLVKIMGGKIITTEADRIHDEGYAHGIKIGKEEGRREGRNEERNQQLKKLIQMVKADSLSLEQASELAELTVNEFQVLLTKEQ